MGGNHELGRAGEERAARWYLANGYEILDRNWRTRAGEIDLIAARHDTIVFCEVKTRSSSVFGRGIEAVGAAKQRRIRGLAADWLRRSHTGYSTVRFDVADVEARGTIEVIEGCF